MQVTGSKKKIYIYISCQMATKNEMVAFNLVCIQQLKTTLFYVMIKTLKNVAHQMPLVTIILQESIVCLVRSLLSLPEASC